MIQPLPLNFPVNYKEPLLWPVFGLGKKAANTVKSCAALASLDLWGDFLVVGRSLFETEIIISWLLQESTEERVRKYIDGIEQERNVLANKAKSGISSFGQILSDVLGVDAIKSTATLDESLRNWSGMNVREMAREIETENNYETLYWVASAFVHSHVLSVIDTNQTVRQNLGILGNIFSLDDDGITKSTSLISMAGPALNVFILLNNTFSIGIGEDINRAKLAQKIRLL